MNNRPIEPDFDDERVEPELFSVDWQLLFLAIRIAIPFVAILLTIVYAIFSLTQTGEVIR